MKSPTQDEVARQAYKLWQDRGCPEGVATEIWFEAEHDLIEAATTTAESAAEQQVADAAEKHDAETVEIQKLEARAPQVSQHAPPVSKPPESGKPLWSKPHSS